MTTLTELKEICEAATPGPWKQGRLLPTQQVKRMSIPDQERSAEIESRLVCANFTSADEGRSRIHLAECSTAELAKFIAGIVRKSKRK
jgi:hypothetical protein